MTKLYYTAPSDVLFEEVRLKAIELWSTMGDEPSYSQSKISRIKDINNVRDNFMHIVSMFDINNQRKLADMLSAEAREAIKERMIAGGQPIEYIVF